MTRNTVAVVSAVLFVVLAALLAVLPVPFVTVGPGDSYNILGSVGGQPAIWVEGVPTYPTSGRVMMPGVSQSKAGEHVSLPDALLTYWSSRNEVLPRAWVYQSGRTSEQLKLETGRQQALAQHYAAVAAMRQAGIPVQELPMVSSVNVAGPAFGRLQEGDFITKIDGEQVLTEAQVREVIARQPVGKAVLFEVLRSDEVLDLIITTSPSNDNRSDSTIGVGYSIGYRYGAQIRFGPDLSEVDASAGLAYALAIYDQITPEELVESQTVGASGTIDPQGRVGRTSNIRQQIYSAEQAGATVFLVPAANCRDVVGMQVGINLLKVDTLKDAISALRVTAGKDTTTEVVHC